MRNHFRYFNGSPTVIRTAVLLHIRFPLSLRQVEYLLHERGIDISHETVRFWWRCQVALAMHTYLGRGFAEEGMVVSAVSAEPVSCINFPDTVPNTGNFSNLQGTERAGSRFLRVLSTYWVENSLRIKTGNFLSRTGNSERVSGNPAKHQGFGSNVDFGNTTWMPLCWSINWVTCISAVSAHGIHGPGMSFAAPARTLKESTPAMQVSIAVHQALTLFTLWFRLGKRSKAPREFRQQ